jgi:hypothetical protein
MAELLPDAVRDGIFSDDVAPTSPDGVKLLADSPLFRFRLRHLLYFVAAVSLLLAGLVTFDGIPAIAFLLGALVVAFHVFGNVLGSRLRSQADRAVAFADSDQRLPGSSPANPPQAPIPQVMTPPWYGRAGDAVPWIPRLTAIAVFLGGSLGAFLLTLTVGDRTSAAGLAVGAVSLAAITGWLAFLGGNFYANLRRGLREALDEPTRDGAAAK